MTVDRHRAWLDMLVQSAREMNEHSVLDGYRATNHDQQATARFDGQRASFAYQLLKDAGGNAKRASTAWQAELRDLARCHPEWADVLPLIGHEVDLEIEQQSRDWVPVRFVKGNSGCLILTVVIGAHLVFWTLVATGVITIELPF